LAYRQATTACLTAIVLMQVVNVHLCRSRRVSLYSIPVFNNHLITAGILAELGLILLIDYTAVGNSLFGTAPIPAAVWLFILPFAVGMLGLEELRKEAVRRRVGSDLESCRSDQSAISARIKDRQRRRPTPAH
jgi:magnesium-transporting ATPase (P-type)